MSDTPSPTPPLVEGVDYVIEAGRWVFLAAYLLRRGYCCGNGCRHCPYRSGSENAQDGVERTSES